MKSIWTVLITLLAAILLTGGYLISGIPYAGQKQESATTDWFLTTVRNRSIAKRIQRLAIPPLSDTSNFKIGFAHYNEMCTTCHGGPGIEPDELAKGLFPPPPQFYRSDSLPGPAKTFWSIKYGIRFTGMAAFGKTHDDSKIWAMTDFLLNKLNKMTPQEYKRWQATYHEEE